MAHSGGLDSTVLLHWLAGQRDRLPGELLACHVNHGLQPQAPAWVEHCRVNCETLAVPFRALSVLARAAPGESPEAAAREARYRFLQALLDARAVLLTAHHRDDQVETVLLQLFRGSGPAGLAAMPVLSRLGEGWLLRPLLHVSRATLVDYADRHGLRWVEDPSNHDTRIPRNWLRHEVLPQLRTRWPGLDAAVSRSAGLCAEAVAVLAREAREDLHSVAVAGTGALLVPALCALPGDRQRRCLRLWLEERGLPVPEQRQLAEIVQRLLPARADAQPRVNWPGAEVRRFRDRLYAGPPLPPPPAGEWRLPAPGELALAGAGVLRLETAVGAGIACSQVPAEGLTVRFRQGGERFRPAGDRHHRTLKQLFQTWGLAPWERERLPLLYAGEVLLAVGECLAAGAQAPPGENGWVPRWQKAPLFVNV